MPALAVTPVVSVSSLMAEARSRALRVVPFVLIAVPLMVSEPVAMPDAALARLSAAPATPNVPPPMLPNWNVSVVLAPSPICAVLLAWPPVMRLCACASWLTLILYLPGTAPAPGVAVRRSLLLDELVSALKVLAEFSVVSAPWKTPTAALTLPYACSLVW